MTRASPLARDTPLILVIGGHDPSGAGIQADIETAASLDCHAVSLVTCLTAQNTGYVAEVISTSASLLRRQFELLRDDLAPFAACKIGLIPTLEVLAVVVDIVRGLPAETPVVLDPVIAAGSGAALMQGEVRARLVEDLWPLCTICTPNAGEARRLAQAVEMDVEALLRRMSGWTLLKGADEATADVRHHLFRDGNLFATYRWPRLGGSYHGSGCTLASALASALAHGKPVATAVAGGLDYTWRALVDPLDIGGAQYLPRRFSR
jgi:hydroxymethylpyrimidine/phosphomethylpyrimidine kinase